MAMKVINIAKEYTTERGNPTRLLVDNVQHTAFPILGLELLPNGEEIIRQWNDMGYSITGEHDLKLIPKPPKIIRKITKYIAVYKSENNNKGCILGGVFDTKKQCESIAKRDENFIKVIKVEFEL